VEYRAGRSINHPPGRPASFGLLRPDPLNGRPDAAAGQVSTLFQVGLAFSDVPGNSIVIIGFNSKRVNRTGYSERQQPVELAFSEVIRQPVTRVKECIGRLRIASNFL
jgi:hypothetical protein